MTWTRRDWLYASFLVGLALVFFWPLFVPGDGRFYFVGGDFVDQFFAFAAHETREFAAGRVPLWMPYAYAGSPFWADIQSAVAYPPSLIVVLAAASAFGRLPFLALEAEAVAHFAMAGVFTYLFARHVLRSRGAALVAAVTFAYGGYLTGYPPLQLAVLESNVWLPLALLGVELIASERTTTRRHEVFGTTLLAFAVGMGVLAGHPQSAMYLLYATIGYFLWRSWPWRAGGVRPWFSAGAGMLAGLGLSAVGWLPALEFLRLSNRAAIDYATAGHGFPPRELLGMLVPGVTHWSPLYVGVLPLVLAVLGGAMVVSRRDNDSTRHLFWVVMGGVALLLSIGASGALFDVFYLVAPGFDLFRGQERSALLISFSLAMLAGVGYRAWDAERLRLGKPLVAATAALFAFALATAVVAPIELHVNALWVVLFSAWSGFAALVAAAGGIRGRRLLVVSILLITLDLGRANGRTNLVQGAPGELQVTPDVAMMTISPVQRVQNDDRLPRNFGVLHGVESTSGASPMRLRTFEQLNDLLAERDERRLWSLLAVSHVLSWRGELPHPAQPVITVGEGDGSSTLFGLESPRPFAWRASNAISVTDDEAARIMTEDENDPFGTVLLHGSEVSEPVPMTRAGLTGSTRRPGESIVTTMGDAPAWIVFSEMFYPGWRAYVDGVETTPIRANIALIAVPVPAGEHEVSLSFASPTMTAGLLLSLITALALLIYMGWSLATRPR